MRWLLNDLAGLLFPEACAVCAAETRKSEAGICLFCRSELPVLLSNPLDNHLPMLRKLEGLIAVKNAFAYLQFSKSGCTQKLLHALKYGRRPEIAQQLGRMMAAELLERGLKDIPDLIIPVPMHPKKEMQRGYNQAYEFACGLAGVFNCEANDRILLKGRKTETQTRKNKLARLLNVAEVFLLEEKEKDALCGRNIWLVDDVLTTGSTLIASAGVLQAEPVASLSVATIAMA